MNSGLFLLGILSVIRQNIVSYFTVPQTKDNWNSFNSKKFEAIEATKTIQSFYLKSAKDTQSFVNSYYYLYWNKLEPIAINKY